MISRNTVVSAAHCFSEGQPKALPRDITVVLGAHNFGDPIEHGRVSSGVKKITIHPHWNTDESNNELALLELTDDIQFNKIIRPVCLPTPNHQISPQLVAAGWGGSQDNIKFSRTPKKVDLSLVDSVKCSGDEHIIAVSDETESSNSSLRLCAKVKGQAGSCLIDDGSGIYQKIDSKIYLRGIMSAEMSDNCAKNKLIAITDISENLEFLSRESGVHVS